MNDRLHYLALPVLWILMLLSWSSSYGQTGSQNSSFFATYTLADYNSNVLVDVNCEKELDLTTSINNDPGVLVDFPTVTPTDPAINIQSIVITSISEFDGTTTNALGSGPVVTIHGGFTATINFTVTTTTGDVDNLSFIISGDDKIKPTFVNAPSDITYSCNIDVPTASGNFYAGAVPVEVTDNCSSLSAMPATINVVYDQDPVSFPNQCTGGTITRRWIATDAFNNKDTITQLITISPDILAPTIPVDTLPDLGFLCSVNDEPFLDFAGLESALGDIVDACGDDAGLMVSNIDISDGNSCPSIWTRTYSVSDSCGNILNITQKITVNDTFPLMKLTSVADASSDCAAGTMSSKDQFATWVNMVKANALTYVSDNCSATVTTQVLDGTTDITSNPYLAMPAGCAGDVGGSNYEIYFIFADACGHELRDTAIYNITDGNGPNIITGAQDVILETCDSDQIQSEMTVWLGANGFSTADDVCSGIMSVTYQVGGVTLDATGVMDSLMAAFSKPCYNIPGYTNIASLINVQFTFQDSCTNLTSTSDAIFAIRDLYPPSFTTMPLDTVVECDGTGNVAAITSWLTNNAGGVATDSCGTTSWTFGAPVSTPGCGSTDTLTYQFVVSDKCGNSSSASAKFIIQDTEGPVIMTAPIDTLFQCDGAGNMAQINTWLTANGMGIANDDCGGVILPWGNDYSGLSDECASTGTSIVTFTASDACGNTTNVTATVGIIDTVPPTIITMAQDTMTECDGSGNTAELNAWLANLGGADASDVCSGTNLTWTNNYTATSDMCGTTGTAVVTFTATDLCGNAITTIATFTITDSVAPNFVTAATDITVDCNGSGNTIEFKDWIDTRAGAVATDDCGGVSWDTVFVGPATLGCGNTKTLRYEFMAVDDCGNSNSSFADFIIQDITGAIFSNVPADITIECGTTIPIGLQGVEALDACHGDLTSSILTAQTVIIGSCANTGDYTNTWNVTDVCGNTAVAQQVVTVIDNTSPLIMPTASSIQEVCGGGDDQVNLETWINTRGGAMSTDVCNASPVWSYTYVTNDFPPITGASTFPTVTVGKCDWSVTVEFKSTDACGNESTTSAIFVLTDVIAPVFVTFPTDTLIIFTDAACAVDTITATTGIPTISDNCAINDSLDFFYVDTDNISDPCVDFTMNTVIRKWTVADHCGNSTVRNQVLILKDITAPIFTVPVDITLECDLGIDPNETGGVTIASDNCSQTVNSYIDSTMILGCSNYTGTFDRHWTVSDACGNTSVGVQQITVEDNTIPIVTATQSMEYNCTSASVLMNTAFNDWVDNHAGSVASDNCTPADSITWTAYNTGTIVPAALVPGSCPGNIEHIVDFIATDACGNSVMVKDTFKVIDDTAPEFISCLEDVTISSSSDGLGDCQAQYSFAPPIITDGCSLDESPCTPVSVIGGTVAVTSSGAGDPNVLVDPVTVNFVVPGPPTTANSIVQIQLDLNAVDGEANDPTSKEYFNIIGEDGSFLGVTNKPATQCGDASTIFTISKDLFNQWAIDGIIEITLDPFNPGPGLEYQGINDICGSTTVGGSITYGCSKLATGFTLEYSLDGGVTNVNVPLPTASITETFPVGENTVTMTATDCSGNANTCSFKVTVEDDEPPVIANCTLAGLPGTLATIDCNPVDILLPRPGGISDNCAIDSYDQTVSAGLVTFTEHPNIDGYVIDTMSVVFSSTIPPPATGLATLTVMFKGDIDNTDISGNPARELFEIVGEDGVSLGITIAGPNCDASMNVISSINITMDKLIAWSADGQIEIKAYPFINNTFFGNDGVWNNDDYGVNPCGAMDTFDVANPQIVSDGGNTAMSMQLVYSATNVSYVVSGATTIAPTIFPIDGSEPTITINPGFNTIKYMVSDIYGNVDSTCTHTINVGSPSLGTPVIGAFTQKQCIGEIDTLIEVSGYVGTSPKWLWYNDLAPLGINSGEDELIATTLIPFQTYTITDQTQNIYVLIQDNLCISDISSTVTITPGLNVIQPIIYISPNPICSGSDFGLYVDNPQLDWVSYTWSGPSGYTGSGLTPIGVTGASPVNSGEYYLTVINTSGCELTASAIVDVKGVATATVTSISYDPGDGGCVSGTDDLTFQITEFPVDTNDEYTYIWSGPNSFTSNLKNAVVPNVTTDDNGQYCVTVFDETGCPSVQKCISVDIKDIPTTPELTVSGSLTELCEGETVTMNATVYSGASDIIYYWSTPNGLETTTVPSLIIDPIGTGDAGTYSVFVNVDGCDSERSNELNMIVNPRPTAPIITGTSTICAGDSLILETPLVDGATYEWSGPNFTASVNKAIVYPASNINAGDYTVRIVSIDGCPSDFSDVFTVSIEAAPLSPIANTSGSVCLDDNTSVLSLIVENGTVGATYEWFNAATNASIGTTTQIEYSITNLSVFSAGTYNFYVVATMPTGCTSIQSNVVAVDMNNIPTISAFAGDDINVCGSGSINLGADMPTEGTGMWTQISGPTATIADVNSAGTTVNGLLDNSEYEFTWTLSHGSCTDFSSDNVKVIVNNDNGVAEAGINQDLCDATSATLVATAAPTGNFGTWTQSTTQSALGAVVLNPSSMTTEVTGLIPGNEYVFTWTLSNKGCGDYSTDVVMISVFGKVTASLAQDMNLCGSVTVSGNNPGDCSGEWSSSNPDVVFANPTFQVTEVSNLEIGENILRWTITCGDCGETFDELIVSYEGETKAEDDLFTVDFVDGANIDVGANDQFFAGATFSIVNSTTNGTLTKNNDGEYSYLADVNSDGSDEFTYEVCSANCPNECDQATATIVVTIDTDCSIPTIITPNEDGYNDEFLIACLRATSKYPNNSVSIFNEWGDEVFQASPYNNDWKGTYNGQDVPVGTYFFIVDFGDGSDPKSGFLLIER